MKTLFRFGVWAALFASTAIVAQTTNPDTLTADPVYKKNCAKCHGKNADGRHFGGPSLRSEKVAKTSADDLRKIITDGKGRMPKYGPKLSAAEIGKLVEEIKTAAIK